MADDLLIFDTRSQRAHSLNATATAVWRACDGEHSPEALAELLGLDRDAVTLALRSLSGCDLLEHSFDTEMTVSRRVLLRRLALTGAATAAAVPVIRSVAVPTAAHAASICTAGSCPPDFFCNSLHACMGGSGLDAGSICDQSSGSCRVGSRCISGSDGYRCAHLEG